MTTCDVSLGGWDGDAAQFYDEKEVTARKPHACHECREMIAKGEKYWRVNGRWDGEFAVYRFCEPCWEILNEFSEDGKTFGQTWDTFQTEWSDGATLQGCLNRLTTVAAKQHMTRQWRKWKGLE